MKVLNKAILPKGFLAAGLSCGIKRSGKPDLALFYSEVPATAAGVFTRNTMKAAPVKLDIELLRRAGKFRAIVVNSGNANCFTGAQGMRNARTMGRSVASVLKAAAHDVFVASTGIIGRQLPVEKISLAAARLAGSLSSDGVRKAARAILTTDTCTKESTVRFACAGATVTVSAVAKGAGMIAPDMATMLCFILTDASLSRGVLKQTLRRTVADSFNCITVDGCMSTNDSVMVLANGASGISCNIGNARSLFAKAVSAVCSDLARKIVLDAEGATKLITIELSGARSGEEARKAALSIANSNLFKTAVYGENPNYGRVIAAVGSSGVACRQERLKVSLGDLKAREVRVKVDLGIGNGRVRVLTSDLTPKYVRINAEYS